MKPLFDAEERLPRKSCSAESNPVPTTYVAADYSASALEENTTCTTRSITSDPLFMGLLPFVGTNDVAIEPCRSRDGRKTFVYL